MQTNAISDSRRTDSDVPTKFYTPATAGSSAGPGRIERFLTRLYERHRVLTRRLE